MSEIELHTSGARLVGSDVGDGPVALLLHAGGERRHVWEPVAEVLATRGFRAIAWDQRGHGDSSSGAADRLPGFAQDVAAMIHALDSMPVVVGASLGGMAAMSALANAHVRRRVAGLVIVDTVPDPDPARVRAFLAATAPHIAQRPRAKDILGRAEELRRAARALDLPTRLVWAAENGPLIDADIARFVELVPHARVHVIEGAGHLIAKEAPDALALEILDELGRDDVRMRRGEQLVSGAPDAASQKRPGTPLPDGVWQAHPTGS
jgi:pimeloyl-ACP methyl ester carboxylesterase